MSTIWRLDNLKRMGKIIQEKVFKKKEPELKSNHGLALIGRRATGPWVKKGKAEESFSLGVVFTVAWPPHAWGKRNSFISLFHDCV